MKDIIIDTDIGNDCDDAGALKVALSLEKTKKCRISAVASCTSKASAAAFIEAMKIEYRASYDVFALDDGFDGSEDYYCKYIVKLEYNPQMSYASGYKKHLRTPKTIVSLGPLHGLNSLSGLDNVDEIYIMGGNFTGDEAEWNISMDIPAAQRFISRSTAKLIFCPFELGDCIKTGTSLKSKQGIVSDSYKIFTGGSCKRSSWDLVTVYLAICGESPYFKLEQGTVSIDGRGVTKFVSGAGNHYVASLNCDVETIEKVLEELL